MRARQVPPGTDPRTRSDGLGWVTRALFPDPRVVLALGPAGRRTDHAPSDALPSAGLTAGASGWCPALRYAVLPSVRHARFLLPLGPRRVRAAALLAFNSLRPTPVRAARAALGALARVGALDLARLPVLTGWLPQGAPEAELLLTAHLSALLGTGPLYAAVGVRPPDPTRKPTLQLFDAQGVPRGYAKIGWNAATRELVRTEAAALRRVSTIAPGGEHPLVPDLLTTTQWRDRTVAVVAPLPAGVRGVDPAAPPSLAAVLAVARRAGPPRPAMPLANSAFLARLTADATAATAGVPAGAVGAGVPAEAATDDERALGDAACDPGRDTSHGVRALAVVRALAQRYGATRLEYGDWHGDWVPWNLGSHGSRLVAWDWEHSGPDVPVGFDLVHDAFHRALILARRPVVAAVHAADEAIGRYAGPLRLDARQRRLLVDGYLIELWLRAWRLAAGGAGWNQALHPALLDAVEQRLGGCAN